jgi:hypothetical protein
VKWTLLSQRGLAKNRTSNCDMDGLGNGSAGDDQSAFTIQNGFTLS